MGFESVLHGRSERKGFGSQRFLASGKDRPHISRSKILLHEDAEQIGLGDAKGIIYQDWMGKRYVYAESLGFDYLITLYDVNSPRGYALRLLDSKDLLKHLKDGLKQVATQMPNIEARIFGLQNGEAHAFLDPALNLLSQEGIRLIEADLFGEELRHVAIDLKTGSSYNVLLEDRNYRPGELANTMTREDLQRSLKAKTTAKR